jgi:hypothetical protein
MTTNFGRFSQYRAMSPIDTAQTADDAWTAAYTAICPKRTWPGDFRYTAAARGEPGSELRRLHDEFIQAGEALSEFFAARRRVS